MYRIVPNISRSGLPTLQALAAGSSAISPEARKVHRIAKEVAESVEQSHALFGEKASALSQLAELAAECSEPSWDEESANAIDPAAVLTAQRLVRALPDGISLPEFAPEPDGSISLDWIQSRNHLLSLSIGPTDRLAYAWLDGTDRGHAVVRFDGCNIPPLLLNGIIGIVGLGNAGLRAA